MTPATAVSTFPEGRGGDAAALVFEYMAATQAETGLAVPARIGELPAALQRESRDLPAVCCPPGALLIADHDRQASRADVGAVDEELPARAVTRSSPRASPRQPRVAAHWLADAITAAIQALGSQWATWLACRSPSVGRVSWDVVHPAGWTACARLRRGGPGGVHGSA